MTNFFKFLFPKGSLKGKILRIVDNIKTVVAKYTNENASVYYYGAYDIDPKNLVFWVCIKSDKTKLLLKSDDNLLIKLRQLLIKYDYPLLSRDLVHIGFESEETIKRESGGNWYLHFK